MAFLHFFKTFSFLKNEKRVKRMLSILTVSFKIFFNLPNYFWKTELIENLNREVKKNAHFLLESWRHINFVLFRSKCFFADAYEKTEIIKIHLLAKSTFLRYLATTYQYV